MKISGFSMVKNAGRLYYPIKEAIMSVLPIVDEFVVAVGDCAPDDDTRTQIESINSPKIKIIDTVWDIEKYPRGTEHAHQTDIAKEHCTGDWLIYMQADEVIHEKYHKTIVDRCQELLNDKEVEGLLFHYKHFWGDYDHFQQGHRWYKNEIRIIRNDKDIHSWISAQSFRRIPNFDTIKNYRCDKKLTSKLKVARVDACIYHYGWVRPPRLMERKTHAFFTNHLGKKEADACYKQNLYKTHYGPMQRSKKFSETHPKVMKERIAQFDWGNELNYSKKFLPGEVKQIHDRFKYRFLTVIEDLFFQEEGIFTYKNYIYLRSK
ncbi:hypothetical protein DMA11_02315 [Marinilabiliaceae bacterium JC017]|nr:hypothetical protein DMA11_02315 [Marinilabiliaceae bacterium JC017]